MSLLAEALKQKKGVSAKKEKEQPKESPSRLKSAMKVAWESVKEDDFDGFASAMESVIKISQHKVEE